MCKPENADIAFGCSRKALRFREILRVGPECRGRLALVVFVQHRPDGFEREKLLLLQPANELDALDVRGSPD